MSRLRGLDGHFPVTNIDKFVILLRLNLLIENYNKPPNLIIQFLKLVTDHILFESLKRPVTTTTSRNKDHENFVV